MLVTAKTSGATPLVIACRNGHYDVAEYLIEQCNADIEQPGSGEFVYNFIRIWLRIKKFHLNKLYNICICTCRYGIIYP